MQNLDLKKDIKVEGGLGRRRGPERGIRTTREGDRGVNMMSYIIYIMKMSQYNSSFCTINIY
jgi:hypothetical protein